MSQEKERTDEERLKFIAKNLNAASVHMAIRPEKRIVQMWASASKWVDISVGEKLELDDLRMLVDEAMTQAESQ